MVVCMSQLIVVETRSLPSEESNPIDINEPENCSPRALHYYTNLHVTRFSYLPDSVGDNYRSRHHWCVWNSVSQHQVKPAPGEHERRIISQYDLCYWLAVTRWQWIRYSKDRYDHFGRSGQRWSDAASNVSWYCFSGLASSSCSNQPSPVYLSTLLGMMTSLRLPPLTSLKMPSKRHTHRR